MRQHRFLSVTICTAALALTTAFAADVPNGKADAPAFTASIPDGQRSAQRFNDGIYGKIWNSPEFAPLKAKLANLKENQVQIQVADAKTDLQAMSKELGTDPFTLVLTRLRFADILIQGTTKPKEEMVPAFRAAFDLGPEFATWLGKKGPADAAQGKGKPLTVPGANAAFIDENGIHTALFGSAWTLTNNPQRPGWLAPVKPTPSAHDAELHAWPAVWAELLPKLITDAHQLAQAQGLITWLKQHPGTIDADADLVPGGVHSHISFPGSSVALASVDRSALAPLPTTTLWSLAIGLDGAAWWSTERVDTFTRIGALQTPVRTAAQVEADLDRSLKQLDPSLSAEALISGLKGTTVLALMQGMPFPTAALALPRSSALDQLVSLMLTKQGLPAPADNIPTVIPLPLPVSLSLVKTGTHWLLTTDAALAGTWGSGQPGGWLDSPAAKAGLAKAGSEAWLVGLSNTALELKTWTGFAAMGLNQAKDLTPQERQSALATLNLATKLAQPGWCVARSAKGRTDAECEGLTGGVMVPAIVAAIALPNIVAKPTTPAPTKTPSKPTQTPNF